MRPEPPELDLADEEEVPSSWAAWADWLAQAVINRISSVLSNFGCPADEAK